MATVRTAMGDAGDVVYNAWVDVCNERRAALARVEAARVHDGDSVTRTALLDSAERDVRRLTRAADEMRNAYATLAEACRIYDGAAPTPTTPTPPTPTAPTPEPTPEPTPTPTPSDLMRAAEIAGVTGVQLADLRHIAAQCAANGAEATVFGAVTENDGVYVATTFYGDPNAPTMRRANDPARLMLLATSRFRSEKAARRRVAQTEATWQRVVTDVASVL